MKKEKILIVLLIFCIIFMTNVFAQSIGIYDDDDINIGGNIEEWASGDKELYNYERNSDGVNTVTLTKYIGTMLINYIPEDLDKELWVTRLADGTYANSKLVYQARIQNGVRYLGVGVFKNCTKLNFASIGSGIGSIPTETFYNNTALKNVIGCENVTSIGDKAFYNCLNMQSVVFGNALRSIGDEAFSECSSLKVDYLPSSIERIGDKAFYGCIAMDNNVLDMPTSLKSIGSQAFKYTNIKYLRFTSSDLPTIGDDFFEGTIMLPEGWRNVNNNASKGYDRYNIIEILYGDVNDDKYVNSTDAAMALDIFKNDNPPSNEADFYKIDLDGSGVINATDAALILDIFKK